MKTLNKQIHFLLKRQKNLKTQINNWKKLNNKQKIITYKKKIKQKQSTIKLKKAIHN